MNKRIGEFWKSLFVGPIITIFFVLGAVYLMDENPLFKYFTILFVVFLGLYLFVIVSIISILDLKKGIYAIKISEDCLEIANMYDSLFLKKEIITTYRKSEISCIRLINDFNFSRRNQKAILVKTKKQELYLIEEFFNESEELAHILNVKWDNN